MGKLQPSDLMTLETYAKARADFRQDVMAHKKPRRIPIGEHISLYFEDRLTMHYQVQEILRTEKIFEEDEIRQELEAYNPLIPDGTNWKATMMIEYVDVDERRAALAQLTGIQDVVAAMVGTLDPVFGIANEDLDRETEEKTSSVHFLRFELTSSHIEALKGGESLHFSVNHPKYDFATDNLSGPQRDSLIADLD
ncbi:MAG: DUF3501 family protein [Pseudomonadota bacterium]